MEAPLAIREDLVIPGHELWFTASRSGGPGGQHVNKTNSRVTLHWDLSRSSAVDEAQRTNLLARLKSRVSSEGVLTVDVDTERSQLRNRELARERLAQIVYAALHEPRKRVPTQASKASQRRRMDAKSQRGEIKRTRRIPSLEE